ncbi:hypothetical protein GE21DRAFT_3954 [Neurospora crassa]|uniref:Uncharacterized protein n=1 Tax=Neurospora crassa (strain ATCC 24698 / 74-OR23-1A / CBS 708.71 / DSM 1257 / FGSC 987) TaxID=367110 RepID=Q7SBD6_NEUCR|nr:hypothetical protein NCU07828 [Neurospora crassa OR74A]EAA33713.2 hypothetical protein NCU07828 [Neurospora crassa OR74A]KHE84654.1 hypothetical protein GE21DRAFT_3954 [Neurospora crassa]|eukprot:XP_962949.2 hypothetical protein NCU07828 [Neurospora crassa OR74A]
MPPLRCANAPAPASLFVQMSMRRTAPFSVLADILLPLRARAHHNVARRIATVSTTTPVSKTPWRARQSLSSSQFNMRLFTTTAPSKATHTLFNPQNDEDGNEMVLEITERAAKRLSEIMTKDSNPYLALRIQVESGGCHGFQYLMKLVTLPEQLPQLPLAEGAAEESEIREDDTIFSYYPDDSPAPASPDLTLPKIILDGPSLELLKGSKVDFTMELIGSQFKIVDNPLATSSCGCGTSFDIKI